MLREVTYKEIIKDTDPVMIILDGSIISLEDLFRDARILIDTAPKAPSRKLPEPETPESAKAKSNAIRARVLKAWNGGKHNASQIAKMTGLSYTTVRKYIPISEEG